MPTNRELWSEIEAMVLAILNNINKRHPKAVGEFMRRNGFRRVATFTSPIEGPEASTTLTKEAADFESLKALLSMIIQERYCWTPENIDSMSLPEVLIALEHAMEYDAPSKRSVWDL